MKVIYYSNTRLPVSQVAAAIHLNRLPPDRVPQIQSLIESFASGETINDGVPVRLGQDESGNEIFVLHLGKAWSLGLQTMGFMLSAYFNPLDWKFFNVGLTFKFPIRAWASVLNQLKLTKLEQKLVAREIQKKYLEITELVRKIKELSIPDG